MTPTLVLASVGPGSAVTAGALPVALFVAVAAGLVSFASPCVLPLVPGFLGYFAGLPATTLEGTSRPRLVLGALLFVIGFSAVFIVGAAAFASAGALLVGQRALLSRIGGAVVILMALTFLGVGGQRSWRPTLRARPGLVGAPVMGVVFGIGWAPCTGPTLAAVMTLATTMGDQQAVIRGVALAMAYCLGLGLPFLAIAGLYSRAARLTGWLRRRQRQVQVTGAGMLLVVGTLLVTGLWDTATAALQARLVSTFTTVL